MLRTLSELDSLGWQSHTWIASRRQAQDAFAPQQHQFEPEFPVARARGINSVPPSLAETVPLQIPLQVWRAALLRPVSSHLTLSPPRLCVEETLAVSL